MVSSETLETIKNHVRIDHFNTVLTSRAGLWHAMLRYTIDACNGAEGSRLEKPSYSLALAALVLRWIDIPGARIEQRY